MWKNRQSVNGVLEQYALDLSGTEVEFLGNHGGFSGAQLWKIRERAGERTCCLRRWPGGLEAKETLERIHSLLAQASRSGFDDRLLPRPLVNRSGKGVTRSGNHLFELTAWLPGQADYWNQPTDTRLRAAARTLAEFHAATGCSPAAKRREQESGLPGLRKRINFIRDLREGLLSRIEGELGKALPQPLGWLREPGWQVLQHFKNLSPEIESRLQSMEKRPWSRQVCIRDIWHDHLLFEGSRVSGLVDFGAIGTDHVATDISRLFGSLFGSCSRHWEFALREYQAVSELLPPELELIVVYDRSTTMLAGLSWLKWILVENRTFETWLPIKQRLESLLKRMSDWT